MHEKAAQDKLHHQQRRDVLPKEESPSPSMSEGEGE
jgi:hypothetical protein